MSKLDKLIRFLHIALLISMIGVVVWAFWNNYQLSQINQKIDNEVEYRNELDLEFDKLNKQYREYLNKFKEVDQVIDEYILKNQ